MKCYLCDDALDANAQPFKIGMREELICFECHTKTVNRRKALKEVDSSAK